MNVNRFPQYIRRTFNIIIITYKLNHFLQLSDASFQFVLSILV